MTYEIDADLWSEIVDGKQMRETFAELVFIGQLSREPTQLEMQVTAQNIRRKMEAGAWGDTTDDYVRAFVESAPGVTYNPEA